MASSSHNQNPMLVQAKLRFLLRVIASVVCLLAVACVGTPPDKVTSRDEALTSPVPLIVSTTINAPISADRYQLFVGVEYTVTVRVAAGTISYLIRLESASTPGLFVLGPEFRDDSVPANSGTHTYTFTLTPSVTGIYQVNFQLRDRGTWNVFNVDGGVAVNAVFATPPHIKSTTINAPIVDDTYQLYPGRSYQAQVVVASGNVGYTPRLESNNISTTMHLTPSHFDFNMPAFSSDQAFNFTVTPDTTGAFQVAFQLRDLGTFNVFNVDGGVAVFVNGNAPRISSTRVVGVAPDATGKYVLTIGKRHDVMVRVVPGSFTYHAAVELSNPLSVPVSANFHNRRSSDNRILDPRLPSYDFHFGITPTEAGQYQLGFQMHDAPILEGGTDNPFNPGAPITVMAASPAAPAQHAVYGVVTDALTGAALAGVTVSLETGAQTTTSSDGHYALSGIADGIHTVSFNRIDPLPPVSVNIRNTKAINVPVSASSIEVDASLEEQFVDLANAGMTYMRYIDYSHGRTLLHAVRISAGSAHVEVRESKPGGYEGGTEIATRLNVTEGPGPLAVINGGFFDFPMDGPYQPWAYLYSLAPAPGAYRGFCWQPDTKTYVSPCIGKLPVLGITGRSSNQNMRIVDKDADFLRSPEWTVINGLAYWDDNHDGVSDVDYAIQMGPRLVDGDWVASPPPPDSMETSFSDAYWARTAVGVADNGDLLMVIADGELHPGAQGANLPQLASFFHDTLGAHQAMTLDGGGSTQMALFSRTTGGYRNVNLITAETEPFQANVSNGISHVENFILGWRSN